MRSIVSMLRRFVGNRRRNQRYKVRLPVKVSLKGGKYVVKGAPASPHLEGHTRDICATGLAFRVPSILLGEHHLAGEGRTLLVSLTLPDRTLELQVVPVRYERLEEESEDTGYVIGGRIINMSDEERALFNRYLKTLKKR